MAPVDSGSEPAGARVAAVIATHGRPTLLRPMLESLGASDDPGVPFEIVVVENGAPAGTGAVCRELALPYPLRYRHVAEPGKSHALNVALEELDAELIVLFDDDARVAPRTVAAFVDAARRYGPGHFFGGAFGVDYEDPPPEWLVPHLPVSAVGWTPGGGERFHDAPDFYGINWAVFREDVLAAGGFAVDRGPTAGPRTIGQETEMQQRLLARGCRGVFVPDAFAWHYVPRARCSVRWALDRWASTHFTFVLTRRVRRSDPALGGVPLWLWKQFGLSALRVATARLRRRSWPDRIGVEMDLARDLGGIRAYRSERRIPRLKPFAAQAADRSARGQRL